MMAVASAWVALLLLAFASGAAANFYGDGTYYGDNGWAGYCAGNVPNAGQPWPPAGGQFGTRVALNSPQFGPHGTISPCGRKLRFRGTGTGAGGNPISTEWQDGMVTNLCPECKYGDLDLGISGDGRWGIEWYWLDDGNDDSGSGANTVQSASQQRVVAPRPTYNWRKWLQKKKSSSSQSSTAKSEARRTYLYQTWLAKQRQARARNASSPAVRQENLWRYWLAKQRAARAKAIYTGRKLLRSL